MVETNGMILRALQIGIWVQEDYPERLTEEQKKLFDETAKKHYNTFIYA